MLVDIAYLLNTHLVVIGLIGSAVSLLLLAVERSSTTPFASRWSALVTIISALGAISSIIAIIAVILLHERVPSIQDMETPVVTLLQQVQPLYNHFIAIIHDDIAPLINNNSICNVSAQCNAAFIEATITTYMSYYSKLNSGVGVAISDMQKDSFNDVYATYINTTGTALMTITIIMFAVAALILTFYAIMTVSEALYGLSSRKWSIALPITLTCVTCVMFFCSGAIATIAAIIKGVCDDPITNIATYTNDHDTTCFYYAYDVNPISCTQLLRMNQSAASTTIVRQLCDTGDAIYAVLSCPGIYTAVSDGTNYFCGETHAFALTAFISSFISASFILIIRAIIIFTIRRMSYSFMTT